MNDAVRQFATNIVRHEQLVEHEAGQAAAGMLLGLRIIDVETNTAGGFATFARSEDPKRSAIAIMAGPLANHRPGWPPRWPLTLVRGDEDEYRFAEAIERAGLDKAGYKALTDQALELTSSQEFEHLALAISRALTQHGRLDRHALATIKSIAEGAEVQHAIKAATVTATDRGEFSAIAATYSVDRQNDQIMRGAFAKTIDHWRSSSKQLPLHWNHEGDAASIIGAIDPLSMRETTQGLQVSGTLDLDGSDMAREAWRAMKTNSMSLSFGYVTTRSHKRDDGVNELHEIDLFEISIVPAPANADTRVLEMKSADDRQVPTVGELREREAALGLAGAINRLGDSRTRIPTQSDLDTKRTLYRPPVSSKPCPGSAAVVAVTSTTPSTACATRPASRCAPSSEARPTHHATTYAAEQPKPQPNTSLNGP